MQQTNRKKSIEAGMSSWVKVIHWELCKRLKFDHTNICTDQIPSREIVFNIEAETDRPIKARRPDQVLIIK